MDDSFSILGLNGESICSETLELGEEIEVKHFVFDDLLDTGETLKCRFCNLSGGFSSYLYVLRKSTNGLLKRAEERQLGCYLGYAHGAVYIFEDFNFKIKSLEKFTLLVEAAEYDSGRPFKFQLVNLCSLPERLSSELKVSLTLFAQSVSRVAPLERIDQLAQENRETIELASAGSERAVEKLEREVGVEETRRLISEFRHEPENMFDTYLLEVSDGLYGMVGTVTSLREISLRGEKLSLIDFICEGLELRAISRKTSLETGGRVKLTGRFSGIAIL